MAANTQNSNPFPPRLDSMQPARTQGGGRARSSLDETCSNYEYEIGDRQPIEELVARSQNVLDGLKHSSDARQPEEEATSENEYEVDSDYGSAGGPIGRMPSRRFGSRSSRRGGRGRAAGPSRSLAAPEPARVASMAIAHGVGTPRHGPSIRPLPLAIRKNPSDASTTSTSRSRGPSRKLTVRKRTASQKPSLPATGEDMDSFERSVERLSQVILRDLPGDPANEYSQTPTSHQPRRGEDHQHPKEIHPPQQSPMAMPRASSDNHVHGHSTRPSMDRSRNTSESRRGSPALVGRQSSSYHRRLDEKARAFQGQGEMVEIPIVDDDGTREINSGRNRSLSLDSQNPDQPLPPYSRAPPAGHRGLAPGARAMAAWADAERASIASRSPIAQGFQLAAILLALVLAIFVVGMNINIIATAVPRISNDFGAFNDSSWYEAAFLMAWCAFQVMFGRLYTVFPVKWVFSSALLVFELGSLLAGVSPNSHALIAGRAIQGIGAGGILAGAFIISALLVPLSKRPLMGGLIGALEGAAMITAPIIGGVFTDQAHWRWCFYINLPVVPVVATIIVLCLHVPPEHVTYKAVPSEEDLGGFWQRAARLAGRLDLVSSIALVPAIVAVLLALQWGGSKFEWNSGAVVSLVVVSILFLAVFCYCQHLKQDLAMLPPRIFTQRTILSGFWFMLCTSSALVVITYFLPLWFQVITAATPSNIGIRLVPMLVAFVVGVLLSGALVSFTGHYAPLMLLGTILMSVGSGLLSTWTLKSEDVLLAAFPAIFGAGCGIAFQQPMVAAQSVLGDEDMPIGISVILFGQAIGTALVLSIAETIFASRLRTNISDIAGAALGRHRLIEGGAQGIIKAITGSDGSLAQLLNAYNKAITQTFYVPVAMAALSVVGAVAIEWRNVKHEEERRRREAELIMNEKQGPRSTSNLHPQHQRSFMAHSIDPCQAIPYDRQQQQQQQQYEQRYSSDADASRPQPYDQANSRMGSPYDQPKSRMGSPYDQSHQFSVGTTGQPAPYPTQQNGYLPNINMQPGLGLDAGNYGQAPASYYEKVPIAGR